MKKLAILLLLITPSIYSQTKSSWIDIWQQSTVSIGIIDTLRDNNVKVPFFNVIGTGVIFYVKYDTIVVPCLVTAKHVFSDSIHNWNPQRLRIRFPWFDEKPIDKYFGIELLLKQNNVLNWFSHPNKNVDLACLPLIIPSNVDLGNSIKMLPYSSLAANDDIFEGAQILVFGYPGVIGKEFHNKALTRFGIIAWVPSKISYDSKILIDCDIYPGNSGGPVFKLPNGMNREGGLVIGGSVSFIGIVTQKGLSANEVLVKQKNIAPFPLRDNMGNALITYESIGIGVIEPASYVRELLKFVQNEINK
jgi:hypothetical protein